MKTLNKVFIIAILSLAYVVHSGDLQNQSNETINWGQSVEGVGLSVGLTSLNIKAGTKAVFSIRLKNSSKDVVTIARDEGSGKSAVAIELISESGKSYLLTPVTPPVTAVLPLVKITGGEVCSWELSLPVSKEVESGNYFIKASTKFRTKGRYWQLTSNTVKVRVVE